MYKGELSDNFHDCSHSLYRQFSYDSQKYVDRTNAIFQKLGANGMSIFVSSGDNGSPSYNCPIDGGEDSLCGAYTLIDANSGDTCHKPALGQREIQQGCENIKKNYDEKFINDLLNEFISGNTNCNLTIDDDQRVQSDCDCDNLEEFSSGNLKITGFITDLSKHLYYPIWPGSSPYITR